MVLRYPQNLSDLNFLFGSTNNFVCEEKNYPYNTIDVSANNSQSMLKRETFPDAEE